MITRKHAFYGILALVSSLGLGMTQSARADLITNGGFETGNFTGWTTSGNLMNSGVYPAQNFLAPHSGTYQALFSGNPYAFITQNLSTTPGASYVLDFWLATTATGNQSFKVYWDGTLLFSISDWPSAFGYTEHTFNVTASSANTELQFDFLTNGGYWGFDDASVNVASVPDAGSTLPLLGCALFGLVALRRKLRC